MESNGYEEFHRYLHYHSPTEKPIPTSNFMNMGTGIGHEEGHDLTPLDPSHGLHHMLLHYSQLHLPSNTNSPIKIPLHKTSPNTSSNSNNNSNSDKAEALIDDRKKRRLFSNRESARRSRMRKKQQIEVLQYQVSQLQTLNYQLSQKIIYMLECNQQVQQQNAQLIEKVSSLQVTLSELFVVPVGHAEQSQHTLNSLLPENSTNC